jgi:hydrogenase maturation protein HypF
VNWPPASGRPTAGGDPIAPPDRPVASGHPTAGGPVTGRRLTVTGTVQGVGFRPFVFRAAERLGLTGRVWNDGDGVTVEAFGPASQLDELARLIEAAPPPAARVASLAVSPLPGLPAARFEIAPSVAGGVPRVAIGADLATCPACAAEVADPADRRFRYPFTNCTDCGPRFTIARSVPYDRPATTMAGFTMCERCAAEYHDPRDRRYHAQPNACPACGPRLSLLDAAGAPLQGDPLTLAGAALRDGRLVAVKGLGGFHLCCDATSSAAVLELRRRKRRDEKPLAVMVADLTAAGAVALLTPAEVTLLGSVERPIVLCRRRPDAALAPELAPGNPRLGLLLPYTPLHQLLLAEAGRALVMTSGNLSEEPIAFDDADARARLAPVADLFLTHDRPIASRCDDSVARVVAGRPLVLRRARGWVPRPIRVKRRFERPTLGVGAQLKNACCLGRGDEATLGPHVGDLDHLATYAAFEAAVERLEAFLDFRPEVIGCDLHPLYHSTRYARARAVALGVPLVEVQHHHAHAASAMAEHGLAGPVLALCWDGTGLGSDGAAWGGELLRCWPERFERLATFRPLALPGGDRAVAEPWRVALAALLDAFDGDPPLDLPLFAAVAPAELEVARRMVAGGFNAPPAHGVGRIFDAAAALTLGRPLARYEGQLALALDGAVDEGLLAAGAEPFPFELDGSGALRKVDLRPLWRGLVGALRAGSGPGSRPGLLATRVHLTLALAGAALVREAAGRDGALPVVLTGGCFANAHLAERIRRELSPTFKVYLHGHVPPGDGGLALGQALVADAVARGA